MFKKGLLVLVPLLAAAGPVALFSAPGWWSHVTASVSSSTSTEKQHGLASLLSGSSSGGDTGSASASATESPLEDVPTYDLSDVFRFDLSPDWIVARWPPTVRP